MGLEWNMFSTLVRPLECPDTGMCRTKACGAGAGRRVLAFRRGCEAKALVLTIPLPGAEAGQDFSLYPNEGITTSASRSGPVTPVIRTRAMSPGWRPWPRTRTAPSISGA